MGLNDFENKIREQLEKAGFDVVEIRFEKRKRLDIIKIFIDTEKGVNLEDCTNASRLLNDYIFENELYEKEFRLEISSPGLDRPLVHVKDFRRNIGRSIIIHYTEDDKTKNVSGKLVAVSDKELSIEDKKKTYVIPINKIIKGNIKLPW